MGCGMLAALDAPDDTGLAAVSGWFAGWERALSHFDPGSELSRLNTAGGTPVAVSRSLWLVLQASLCAARLSGERVVPTLLPTLEAAGYDRPFAAIAERADDEAAGPARPAPRAGWRAIRCDAAPTHRWLSPGTGGWAAHSGRTRPPAPGGKHATSRATRPRRCGRAFPQRGRRRRAAAIAAVFAARPGHTPAGAVSRARAAAKAAWCPRSSARISRNRAPAACSPAAAACSANWRYMVSTS